MAAHIRDLIPSDFQPAVNAHLFAYMSSSAAFTKCNLFYYLPNYMLLGYVFIYSSRCYRVCCLGMGHKAALCSQQNPGEKTQHGAMEINNCVST